MVKKNAKPLDNHVRANIGGDAHIIGRRGRRLGPYHEDQHEYGESVGLDLWRHAGGVLAGDVGVIRELWRMASKPI